jgi:hypothetical protein
MAAKDTRLWTWGRRFESGNLQRVSSHPATIGIPAGATNALDIGFGYLEEGFKGVR